MSYKKKSDEPGLPWRHSFSCKSGIKENKKDGIAEEEAAVEYLNLQEPQVEWGKLMWSEGKITVRPWRMKSDVILNAGDSFLQQQQHSYTLVLHEHDLMGYQQTDRFHNMIPGSRIMRGILTGVFTHWHNDYTLCVSHWLAIKKFVDLHTVTGFDCLYRQMSLPSYNFRDGRRWSCWCVFQMNPQDITFKSKSIALVSLPSATCENLTLLTQYSCGA